MAIPVWTPGQVLTAADVNRWFVPILKIKGSDQSFTSNTTLADDPDLQSAVEANAVYTFFFNLQQTAASGGDLKTWILGPTGATANSGIIAQLGANTTRGINSIVSLTGSGFIVPLLWMGTLFTGVNAGTFKIQYAQNTSNGTATTVKAGSTLTMVRAG
jgi:hypothetical protein